MSVCVPFSLCVLLERDTSRTQRHKVGKNVDGWVGGRVDRWISSNRKMVNNTFGLFSIPTFYINNYPRKKYDRLFNNADINQLQP